MYQLEICDANTNREGRPQEYGYDLCERKLFYCLRQERDESRDCAVGDKANRDRQTRKKLSVLETKSENNCTGVVCVFASMGVVVKSDAALFLVREVMMDEVGGEKLRRKSVTGGAAFLSVAVWFQVTQIFIPGLGLVVLIVYPVPTQKRKASEPLPTSRPLCLARLVLQ